MNFQSVRAIGIEVATKLCEDLLAENVPGINFYPTNTASATMEFAKNLGLAANE